MDFIGRHSGVHGGSMGCHVLQLAFVAVSRVVRRTYFLCTFMNLHVIHGSFMGDHWLHERSWAFTWAFLSFSGASMGLHELPWTCMGLRDIHELFYRRPNELLWQGRWRSWGCWSNKTSLRVRQNLPSYTAAQTCNERRFLQLVCETGPLLFPSMLCPTTSRAAFTVPTILKEVHSRASSLYYTSYHTQLDAGRRSAGSRTPLRASRLLFRREVDIVILLLRLPCPPAPIPPGNGLPGGLLECLHGRRRRKSMSNCQDVVMHTRLLLPFHNMKTFCVIDKYLCRYTYNQPRDIHGDLSRRHRLTQGGNATAIDCLIPY